MRKLIVQEFVTLDNFAAGLHDELDFMPQTTPGDWTDSVEQNQWDFVHNPRSREKALSRTPARPGFW